MARYFCVDWQQPPMLGRQLVENTERGKVECQDSDKMSLVVNEAFYFGDQHNVMFEGCKKDRTSKVLQNIRLDIPLRNGVLLYPFMASC